MPDVRADPDKLRSLASALTKAAQECEQIARTAKRGLDVSGWKDAERVKFEQVLGTTLRPLLLAAERLMSDHVPQLSARRKPSSSTARRHAPSPNTRRGDPGRARSARPVGLGNRLVSVGGAARAERVAT
jgi:hypothetical protein